MTYAMPSLPYAKDALEPAISEETLDYHYGKHLQTYVNNLISLVSGTRYEGMSVEEIVATAPEGAILDNAGQVLNHTLYFLQFSPRREEKTPSRMMENAFANDFGNFENLRDEMTKSATTLFGAGWTWLAKDKDGRLRIVNSPNGGNPLRQGMKPLLGFDVWEHAYYLDFQNRRTEHLAKLWEIIDWHEVEKRM